MANICSTNKLAKQICDSKAFWVDKYDRHNFYLPILEEDQTYLKMFDWIKARWV